MAVLKDAEIAAVAREAGWTGNNLVTAVAVALAESGGDPANRSGPNSNGTYDHGLFQINSVHDNLLKQGNWQNPLDNAKMAMAVYKEQGWRGWSAYNNASYGKFQGRGMLAVSGLTTLPANWKDALGLGAGIAAGGVIPGGVGTNLGANIIPGVDELKALVQKIWDAIQTVIQGVQKLLEFTGQLGKGIAWLANSENWVRVGYFIGGLALCLAAVNRMTHVGTAAAKVAVTVAAPEARAAGMAAKTAGKSAVKASMKTAARNAAKTKVVETVGKAAVE